MAESIYEQEEFGAEVTEDVSAPVENNVAADGRGGELADLDEQGAKDYVNALFKERYEKNKGKGKDYTKTQLAVELGLGTNKTAPPKLSAFLAGDYLSPHTIVAKINQYRKLEHKRRLIPDKPPFAFTTVSKIVFGQIQLAQAQRVPVMIYGDAGIGKTSAVVEFARQFPECAVKIEADTFLDSPSSALQSFVEVLDVHQQGRIKQKKAVVEALREGSKVVIIDEAQFWSAKTLEAVRMICEAAEVGLVLVGNHDLHDRMKVTTKSEAYSRIDSRVKPKKVTRAKLKRGDAELLFEGYGLDKAMTDELYSVFTNTNKSVRGAAFILANAIMKHGADFTIDDLRAERWEYFDDTRG